MMAILVLFLLETKLNPLALMNRRIFASIFFTKALKNSISFSTKKNLFSTKKIIFYKKNWKIQQKIKQTSGKV